MGITKRPGSPRKPPTSLEAFAAANSEDPLPTEVRALRTLVLRYKRQIERQRAALYEVVRDALQEAFEPIPRILPVKAAPAPKRKSRTAESQHMLLSDLQCGKQTRSYNMEVLADRMRRYFDTCLHLAEIARVHHPVDELVIHLNGDLVEGELIYPGQQMEIETNVLTQAVFGAQMLAGEIARVAAHYPVVRIYSTSGNHGRGGKGFDPESNWDTVMAYFIKFLLQQQAGISVEVSPTWYTVVRAKGWGFLQTHGDQINAWMSIPIYGIIQRTMRWLDSIPEPFDYVLLGHFHNMANFVWNFSEIIVNPTPESGNEYARRNLGMSGYPAQMTFFCHPEHGITSRYPVWLAPRRPRIRAPLEHEAPRDSI